MAINKRQFPGNTVIDESSIQNLMYNDPSGARKSVTVGPCLIPLGNGAGGYTTNASVARALPNQGSQLAFYNSDTVVHSITFGTSSSVVALTPGTPGGTAQAQTVTTVADIAGSLNSTYFTLSSINLSTGSQKNFYLWLDNGTGVDPAPAGLTSIHVTYTTGDTANTIAGLIRAALNALTNDFVASGAGANVIITNTLPGRVPPAADGTAPTGFAFSDTLPGSSLFNAGIPIAPGTWLYLSGYLNSWVVTDSNKVYSYLVQDFTTIVIQTQTNASV